MFKSMLYSKSQEDYEHDSQWLAEMLERCNQESTEANDSDTLSCFDLGSIDDVSEVNIKSRKCKQ